MACAPCIRGHRSTKCAHHDRVMIAVKKPGRPLSTCPHAPGVQCGCGGVQAAIPIQHHGCRPPTTGLPLQLETTVKKEDDTVENNVQSPTRTAQRVKKIKSNVHSRKQSIDPTALERMNPSSLNIMLSPSTASSSITEQNGGSMPPSNGSPLSSQASMSPKSKHPALPIEAASTSQRESTASPPTTGSCCSSRKQPVPSIQNEHSTLSNQTNGASSSTQPVVQNGTHHQVVTSGGGCCSSRVRAPTQFPQVSLPGPQPALPPGFSQPVQHFNHIQSAIYTQPSLNGAAFWPAQVPTQASGYVYMNGIAPQYPPVYQVYSPATPMAAYPVMSGLTAEQNSQINSILGRPMQCQCGDVCECLGCIDHPFNTVTRDYVASAINVSDWTKSGDDDADGSTEDMHSSEASSTMPSPTGDSLLEQILPQQQEGMPHQAVSSDYLVFNYTYGCLGEPEHCPCGDDCACVGCAIHGGSNNGNNASSAGPPRNVPT